MTLDLKKLMLSLTGSARVQALVLFASLFSTFSIYFWLRVSEVPVGLRLLIDASTIASNFLELTGAFVIAVSVSKAARFMLAQYFHIPGKIRLFFADLRRIPFIIFIRKVNVSLHRVGRRSRFISNTFFLFVLPLFLFSVSMIGVRSAVFFTLYTCATAAFTVVFGFSITFRRLWSCIRGFRTALADVLSYLRVVSRDRVILASLASLFMFVFFFSVQLAARKEAYLRDSVVSVLSDAGEVKDVAILFRVSGGVIAVSADEGSNGETYYFLPFGAIGSISVYSDGVLGWSGNS